MQKTIIPCPIRNIEELQNIYSQTRELADGYEVWLGGITNFDGFLEEFKKWKPDECFFLGVNKNFEISSEFRALSLQRFLSAGGDLVDMDIDKYTPDEIRSIPLGKLVLSYHNYTTIPNCELIAKSMKSFSPSIYKLAVTPESETQMLEFVDWAESFEAPAIFTTMGNDWGALGREKLKNITWAGFKAFDPHFSTAVGQDVFFDHKVYIAVGSSIGDALAIFAEAESFLTQNGVKVVCKSSYLQTDPYGGVAQNLFHNGVWEVLFRGSAMELLDICKQAEKNAGSAHLVNWADRELDLDILVFKDEIHQTEKLTIPHKEMHKRDFVLDPLREIDPDLVREILAKNIDSE